MTVKIVTEEIMNSSLHEVHVPRGARWVQDGRCWEPGYYIVNQEWPGEPFDYLEGPIADEAYAKHRAQSVHGMAPPPDYVEPEITEDDLPW